MAEAPNTPNSPNNAQPVFTIEKIFLKDASVEVPNAPEIYMLREQPQIEIQLHNESKPIQDGYFQCLLTVTVTAKIAEKTMFLVEASQGGIFQIRNVPQADLEPVLAIGCPNIIFPYIRETISDLVSRAGFASVLLNPVNFEALYQAKKQQESSASPIITTH
jgi:preprotein translocase subunit SecB